MCVRGAGRKIRVMGSLGCVFGGDRERLRERSWAELTMEEGFDVYAR